MLPFTECCGRTTKDGVLIVRWESKKKSAAESQMVLKDCKLALGHSGGLFAKDKKLRANYSASRCFSVLSGKRSAEQHRPVFEL